MARVFVLEDDATRIQWFRRIWGPNNQLDIASEVGAGIRYLRAHDYDVIFLDHDLEPSHYQALNGYTADVLGTGYDVAKWLEENPVLQRQALVVLHSLNPEGRQRMESALAARKPLVVPFTHLCRTTQQETILARRVR